MSVLHFCKRSMTMDQDWNPNHPQIICSKCTLTHMPTYTHTTHECVYVYVCVCVCVQTARVHDSCLCVSGERGGGQLLRWMFSSHSLVSLTHIHQHTKQSIDRTGNYRWLTWHGNQARALTRSFDTNGNLLDKARGASSDDALLQEPEPMSPTKTNVQPELLFGHTHEASTSKGVTNLMNFIPRARRHPLELRG